MFIYYGIKNNIAVGSSEDESIPQNFINGGLLLDHTSECLLLKEEPLEYSQLVDWTSLESSYTSHGWTTGAKMRVVSY